MDMMEQLNREGEKHPIAKVEDRPAAKAEDGYAVGYGKPPVEYRFKKKKSGNPKGRPRKRVEPVAEVSGPLCMRPMQDLMLAEVFRPVAVTEAGTTVEMPAIQAAFREMGLAAARGDRFAFAAMTDFVRESEAEQARVRREEARQQCLRDLEAAREYKRVWAAVLADAEEEGLDTVAPNPHPDHVHFDAQEPFVRCQGRAWEGPPLSLDDLAGVHATMKAVHEFVPDEAMPRRPEDRDRAAMIQAKTGALMKVIERHLPEEEVVVEWG